MAQTKDEMIKQILELDADAETEGLKSAELETLLKSLKEKAKAQVTTTEPEVTTTEPEVTTTEPEVTTTEPEVTTTEPTADEQEPTKVFVVATGRAVTSRRGIIAEGQEVKAQDFSGGDETISDLIDRKILVQK